MSGLSFNFIPYVDVEISGGRGVVPHPSSFFSYNDILANEITIKKILFQDTFKTIFQTFDRSF